MQAVERALLHGLADPGVQLAGARSLDLGCGGGYFLHRLKACAASAHEMHRPLRSHVLGVWGEGERSASGGP